MERLRVGLIGTGPWATQTHAPVLAGHPGAVLSGIWGRRPKAAAELASAHATTAYEDVDELFAASDAVAFAVPPDVQAPLAERAAAAGCHLLLDKPVATSPAAARGLVDAVERAGVESVVFFTLRFAPPMAEWLARRAEEGPWFTARADWYSSFFAEDGTGAFDSPWRATKGGLWDVGPHALAVLTAVLGEVTSVTAAPGPADTVHLVLRHAGGASSTATLTLRAPRAAEGLTLEFRGERGTAVPPGWGESGWGDSTDAFRSAVDALVRAAGGGERHACDVRFGLRVTEILADAERQADARRETELPAQPPTRAS
ncbi:Gfo/Idh/MocA family protein [Streptomyces sp. NPDC127108]|uniref:Gfo/Idh/MocA family protein n=1 Tax=Streptomyces sp. NPDC127108 TaxID=3345361 RepID=UPI00362682C1